jgi:hypothetical protein
MARGRMINTTICADKRVNDLSDDTSRLAFTWLIPFADKHGRTHGDPAMLCSMLFPRRRDVDPDRMAAYIREWATLGLVVWYEASGDLWIEFPAFSRNQPGLRQDREPDSSIPSPVGCRIVAGSLPDSIQQDADKTPDECPPKRREENETEEKASAASDCRTPAADYVAESIRAYESTIGLLSGATQSEEIRSTLTELYAHGVGSWWKTALLIAADNNKRSWSYVRAILENHLRDGTAPERKNGGVQISPGPPQKRIVVVHDPKTGERVTKEVVT